MKKQVSLFLMPFVFLLGFFLVQGAATMQAKEITNVITKATVNDGNPITVGAWQAVKLELEYSIPNGVNKGDTTSITLPKEFNVATPIKFQITGAGGTVIANASVSATDPRTLVLTYTDYVETHSNTSGKFQYNIQIDDNIAKTSGNLPVNLTVNGVVIPAGTVTYRGPVVKKPLDIIKGGWTNGTDPTKSQYKVSINQSNKNLTNVIVTDSLKEPGTYIVSSVKVTQGIWDADLNLMNQVDVTAQYIDKFTWNGSSFVLNVGNLNGLGLRLDYSVQRLYEPLVGEKFTNTATVVSDEINASYTSTFSQTGAGGSGEGYTFKIQIRKESEDGPVLKGAKFDIIRDRSGQVVAQIETDDNGIAEAGNLLKDNYTLKETQAPAGYELADDVKVTPADFGKTSKIVNRTIIDKKTIPAPTTATLEATKVLQGKPLEAGKYEFELKEGGTVVATATNDAAGKVSFTAITYTAAGSHTYTISEKAGSEAGVTYDTTVHTVKVEVTDDGQGQLVATVTDNNPTFTNKYTTASTTATLEATKVLQGKPLEAGKYEFELKEGGTVVATATNDAAGKVSFTAITYTAAGSHTYTISEKAGSEAGITYDTTVHTVKVEVTDDGQGQLVATVTDNNPTFTNKYTTASTTATLEATKVLQGKPLEAGKYEFELKEGGTVVATATNDAAGKVSFTAITYTAAGSHTYTISEKAGSEAGVTYDTTVHTVKVEVTDDGQGQLVATVTDNNPTFTNKYTTASTTATLEATKVLQGKPLEAGKYEFELKEGGTVVATATNDAAGKVSFTAITYTAAGSHTYTISEKAGSEAGITYDTTVHTVKVEVTDDGQGQLVATVTDNNPTFINKYTAPTPPPTPTPMPGTATLEATKVLQGKPLEAGKYEFELKEGGTVVATATNDAAGKVSFTAITYTAAGSHTYTISEKAGSEAGITYDTTVHTVKVEVTDDGQGQLVATVTDNNPTFINKYTAPTPPPTPTPMPGTATLEATKVLQGKPLEAGKYEFELKEGGTVVATATNDAAGKVSFTAITYTAAGSHTYTISEKAGSEAGVTYDTTVHTVKVEVTDDGQGQLVATVTDNNPTFTNKYTTASTTATLEATKVLQGKPLEAGKYEFELKEGGTVVATATNDAAGKVSFTAITYTAAGSHTYTISEKAGSEAGITYDTTVHTVKVEVTDDGQGQLVATVTDNNPTFINKYTAPTPPPTPTPMPGTATLEATKVLQGKPLEAGKYEFELKEGGTVVATATNDAAGKVSFTAITYTAAGSHTYTISEKAGSEAGITYDTTVHTVKVEVTDDGQGQLVATVTDNNPTFINKYTAPTPPPTPTPMPGTATLEATKVLQGKPLEAGKYEFELKEGGTVVATATNDAAGKVSFTAITYTAAGSHTYTISEKAGSEAGITYDTTVHTVKVEVTDDGQGQLVATVTDNNPTFINKYTAPTPPPTPTPMPGTATLEATKVLQGKPLEAGKYEFELKEGGTVVATATNDAAGKVSFTAITYTAAGSHTYTISEKAGSEAGVTYDTTVHTVKVEVTDDGQGQLVATVTDNNPTFTNVYKDPAPSNDGGNKTDKPKDKTKKELPKTGTAVTAESVVAGLILLVSVFVYGTKKVQ